MGNYDFKLDLPVGKEGEALGEAILRGRFEVKRDQRARFTGNIAIEVEDRGRPSGIMQSPADWWIVWVEEEDGSMERALLVKTDRLKQMISGKTVVPGGDGGLARMVLLRVSDLFPRVVPKRDDSAQERFWDK